MSGPVTGTSFAIRLAKQDFKFSVAHFTIFSADDAEPLHGHNYRLALEVEGTSVDELGLLADCDRLKKAARAICATLDDKVLLPGESPYLAIGTSDDAIDCHYGSREYRFPRSEVLVLPVANVTMELLARWSWERLQKVVRGGRVSRLEVEIEETPGQLCRFSAPVATANGTAGVAPTSGARAARKSGQK
ncbi:MAG: 6-carboxytetrahydropterin synthase [Thermoanaerobaculia bacterium]